MRLPGVDHVESFAEMRASRSRNRLLHAERHDRPRKPSPRGARCDAPENASTPARCSASGKDIAVLAYR